MLSKVLLVYRVTPEQFDKVLGCVEKTISVLYKSRPNELNIGPCDTGILLKLLKSNMNVKFVTGVYAMLKYLTSYLCSTEYALREHMKNTSKEAYRKDIKGEMLFIVNAFLTKHEVSMHKAVKRVLSLPMRHSKVDVLYVSISLNKNSTRLLTSLSIL